MPPFDPPTPTPQQGVPVCVNCGQRPGTVRMVFNTEAGRRAGTLCEQCARELMNVAANRGEAQDKTAALDEFGRDLTEDAREGRIDPVIGRAVEIEQTVEILARRRKNNAVLIGQRRVGNSAIVEGL